jgi:hypothetical protein
VISRKRSEWLWSGSRRHHPHDPHRHHPAAFDAIAATVPVGTVAFETKVTPAGERVIYLDDREADRLSAMRGPLGRA